MVTLRSAGLLTFLFTILSIPLSATTWYVRADGGTRNSAKVPTGECDGKSDVAYRGSGTNQHCAFNDVRYMWMDGTYGNSVWVIAGGDTLVIRGCHAVRTQVRADNPHCRVGWDKPTGNDPENFWCAGVSSFWGCGMPPPPSGTSAQHTRILGACAYGAYTCNPVKSYPYTSNNLTQIYGSFAADGVMWLTGSRFVDIEGLEITTHNGQCSLVGSPSFPRNCSTSPPMDDFSRWGVLTNNATSNLLLQDVYIHGFTNIGIGGAIGGPVTLTRVMIAFNGFAGWNFDDGHNTPDAPGSSITASYVTMEGNGCMEEYPILHKQFPALNCWDSNSGGFGDSWSGQDTKLGSFLCDHCVMAYNTKDGFIGPHTLITYLKITNSESYGNMGQQWKWGTSPGSTTIFENNLTVGDCGRMSEPLPGAPPGYNRHLTGFCRAAGDVFSFFTSAHSTVQFVSNSTVGDSATIFDLSCGQSKTCDTTSFVFRNNIVLGFLNPRSNPSEVPALFYFSDASVKVSVDHDLFYNLRSTPCSGVGRSDLICEPPAFVDQPNLTLGSNALLDNFNFHPTMVSPARGRGIAISDVLIDHYGSLRPNPPAIGAVEPVGR
jgi:hypothetical protein